MISCYLVEGFAWLGLLILVLNFYATRRAVIINSGIASIIGEIS